MEESYYESAEGIEISRSRMEKELRAHGVSDYDIDTFYGEMGVKEYYDAQAVLRWLGY